jgi:hypothetical protein
VTSSRNTKNGSKGSKPEPTLEAFFATDDQDPEKDEALVALEKQLEAAKDARREERFMWIVVVVILVDVLWFRNAPNATFPVVILVLEAVVLFILANRMGVDEAKGLFERLLQSISRTAEK